VQVATKTEVVQKVPKEMAKREVLVVGAQTHLQE
jgi:hypothetical protein